MPKRKQNLLAPNFFLVFSKKYKNITTDFGGFSFSISPPPKRKRKRKHSSSYSLLFLLSLKTKGKGEGEGKENKTNSLSFLIPFLQKTEKENEKKQRSYKRNAAFRKEIMGGYFKYERKRKKKRKTKNAGTSNRHFSKG